MVLFRCLFSVLLKEQPQFNSRSTFPSSGPFAPFPLFILLFLVLVLFVVLFLLFFPLLPSYQLLFSFSSSFYPTSYLFLSVPSPPTIVRPFLLPPTSPNYLTHSLPLPAPSILSRSLLPLPFHLSLLFLPHIFFSFSPYSSFNFSSSFFLFLFLLSFFSRIKHPGLCCPCLL